MLKRNTFVFIALFTFILSEASAQIGGSAIYPFLNIPASARIAAMGGTLISVKDDDLNSALQNPAALNPSMDKYLALSALSMSAGIKFSDVAFAKDFKKLGTFDIWMHAASYGDFKETDETGVVTGSFTAADYALSLGWGHQLNKVFSVGANLKGIYSDYYLVNSFGLVSDIGITFQDSSSSGFFGHSTLSIVTRNIGAVLKDYTATNSEPLRPEAMIALSQRLPHAPFRFTVLYRHLEKFDLTYLDPNDPSHYDAITATYDPQETSFFGKLLEHINGGVELLFSKNFYISGSYNNQRRYELTTDGHPGIVGFSFGAGIKISKFMLSYGRTNFHLAGGGDHFSVAVNLGEFSKKK